MKRLDSRLEDADIGIYKAQNLMSIALDNLEDERLEHLFDAVVDNLRISIDLITDYLEDPEDNEIRSDEIIRLAKITGKPCDELFNILRSKPTEQQMDLEIKKALVESEVRE